MTRRLFSFCPPPDLLEQLKKFLTTLQEPIIVLTTGILIGIFFSTIVTCLVIKCHRKKKSRNLVEDLEMVTTQTVPKVENDGIHDVEAAEGEAEFADLLVPDDDMVPEEIEYSNIDFFALKKRDSTEAEEKQKTTETEYAEINTGGTENRQKDGEEDSEMLVGENADQVMINEDDEAKENKLAEDVENRQKDGEEDSEMLVGEDADQVMINEDDEAKENKLAEDAVGEDFHRYSSVKDILDESVDE
ncbi:uncharacterized protein [Leuresthes tenuis]|uniref:uncharacterized protein n=1 Tax=Leuresthes tenuis TaxID=355514 RepID=UPI003B500316